LTDASDRDADHRREGASPLEASPTARPGPPPSAEPRAGGWRREGVQSETVGTGSFFALGCSLVAVAVVVLGVVVFLLLRWL
jgi:hypothetical protein